MSAPTDARVMELGGFRDLDGVRAMITGGTRGIGAATVSRFLAGGAHVVAVARTVDSVPHGAQFISADLTSAAGCATAAHGALDLLGGIDVLVDNVGENVQAPGQLDGLDGAGPTSADDELWQANIDINLLAAVRIDRVIVPTMVAQGHGSVIHISSGAARWPQTAGVPYAAAKAALNVYSKGLAGEVGPAGVRVTAVMPGLFDTETFRDRLEQAAHHAGRALDDVRADFVKSLGAPLGRAGRTEEAAELIAFLGSSRSTYLTGTTIALDGGLLPTL